MSIPGCPGFYFIYMGGIVKSGIGQLEIPLCQAKKTVLSGWFLKKDIPKKPND